MTTKFEHMRKRKRSAAATLTEAEVKVIKKLLAEGELGAREISHIYQVGTETIRRIAREETWSWVKLGKGQEPEAELPIPKDTPELAAASTASAQRLAAMLAADAKSESEGATVGQRFADAIDQAKRPDRDLEEFKKS